MDFRLLENLEYDKLLKVLESYCQSGPGQRTMAALRPVSDSGLIKAWQDETEDAISLVLNLGQPPLYGIKEIRPYLARAGKGGVLNMGELLDIAELLRVSQDLLSYVSQLEEKGASASLIAGLFSNQGLQEDISRSILSQDSMADKASHTLYSIRQSMRDKQDKIKERMNAIMGQAARAGYLSENLITLREGRYVLPVKASNRAHVKGLVHAQSSSGATVFIEPMALVELNNEIRDLELQEEAEIQRILKEFSSQVALYKEELDGNEKALAYIDFTFAKANYALDTHCHRPKFSDKREIDLKAARHPLLGPDVVPIDIELGKDFDILIITGPNTGGKTVSLKTLGLMQCMGQAGLQIPCKENSQLAIFSSIYADIGDKQSIEQSLSTFSASMTNIVKILNKADENSLILFDELGSGTDPTEGAAMAMAILERLRDYDIRTVATTHYAELKVFAIREEGVQNASVEFDISSLSPTYRLIIGLPGKSNAFEIAKRLGLKDDILDEAQKYLDRGGVRFESVLADIETRRKNLESEEEKIKQERIDYTSKLKSMQNELTRAQAAYDKDMTEAREEADRIIKEAESEARSLIKTAKSALKGSRPELDRALSTIDLKAKDAKESAAKISKKLTDRKNPKNKDKDKAGKSNNREDLKVGDTVKVLSLDQDAIIIDGPDKNGDLLLRMGILKINSNIRDLIKIKEEKIQVKSHVKGNSISQAKAMENKPQLDLRGFRYEEAISRADKYLDDCLLTGYDKVRIIHGKGTGALRKGIHDFLKNDPRVSSFDFADAREGGSGATDIILK